MDPKNRIESSLIMLSWRADGMAWNAWQYPHKASTGIGLIKPIMAFDSHDELCNILEFGNIGQSSKRLHPCHRHSSWDIGSEYEATSRPNRYHIAIFDDATKQNNSRDFSMNDDLATMILGQSSATEVNGSCMHLLRCDVLVERKSF